MKLGPLSVTANRGEISVSVGRVSIGWRRNYAAADLSRYPDKVRSGSRWRTADDLIRESGGRVRDIGRYLVRNDITGATIPRKRALRVAGAQGPMPQVGIPGGDAIEEAFRRWARRCSLDGEDSWGMFCNRLLRSEDAAGEAFAFWDFGPGGFAVGAFEPEQLYAYWGAGRLGDEGTEVRDGIRYDRLTGRKVAYLFAPYDPANPGAISMMANPVEVPASRVAHLYDRDRPTQTRGVSLFAQMAIGMSDRRDARFAHLTLSRVAAYMGLFIHTENQPSGIWSGFQQDVDVEDIDPEERAEEIRLEPGGVNVLRENERISLVNAKTPDLEFQNFDKTLTNEMAVHADLPAASLSGDYSQVNYSSARMAARDNIMAEDFRRARFETQLADRVFAAWLVAAAFSGEVELSGSDALQRALDATTWSWPARPTHDPKTEAEALAIEVAQGFVSWGDVVRERGGDPETQAKKMAADRELFAKYDLPWPGSLPGQAAPAAPSEKAPADDDESAAVEEETA